jgi:hypothetical protein
MGAAAGAAGAASSAGTGIAGASAGMAGSGAAMGAGMGAGGATAASLGGSAMGTGTLAGSMGASSGSIGSAAAGLGPAGMPKQNYDWQGKLKESLNKMAEEKISDLRFANSFSPNQQTNNGYNENVQQRSFKNSDLYNKLMQEQMNQFQSQQIKRYHQGV